MSRAAREREGIEPVKSYDDIEDAVRWQLGRDTARMAVGISAIFAFWIGLTFVSLPWTYPHLLPPQIVEFSLALLLWCGVYIGLIRLSQRLNWSPRIGDAVHIVPLILLEGMSGYFYGTAHDAMRLGIMPAVVTQVLTLVYFVPRLQRALMIGGMLAARLGIYFSVRPDPTAAAVDDYIAVIEADSTVTYLWVTATMIFASAAAMAGDMLHRFASQLARIRWRERARVRDLQALADAAAHRYARLQDETATARLDERSRIARELHDEFGQIIVALGLEVEAATLSSSGASSGSSTTHAALLRMGELATRARASLVDVIGGVAMQRRLNERGLVGSLSDLVTEHQAKSGITIDFDNQLVQALELDDATKLALYRIAQEALTNIQRHARAQRASIRLERRATEDGSTVLAMRVGDDGVGFTAVAELDSPRHNGIRGMRERAEHLGGTLSIATRVGSGAEIFVRVPMFMTAAKDSANEASSPYEREAQA